MEHVAQTSGLAGGVSLMGAAVSALPRCDGRADRRGHRQGRRAEGNLSTDQVDAMTRAVLAVPATAQVPALAASIAAAGQAAGLTDDQVTAMTAPCRRSPGATADQLRGAIATAGQAAAGCRSRPRLTRSPCLCARCCPARRRSPRWLLPFWPPGVGRQA